MLVHADCCCSALWLAATALHLEQVLSFLLTLLAAFSALHGVFLILRAKPLHRKAWRSAIAWLNGCGLSPMSAVATLFYHFPFCLWQQHQKGWGKTLGPELENAGCILWIAYNLVNEWILSLPEDVCFSVHFGWNIHFSNLNMTITADACTAAVAEFIQSTKRSSTITLINCSKWHVLSFNNDSNKVFIQCRILKISICFRRRKKSCPERLFKVHAHT